MVSKSTDSKKMEYKKAPQIQAKYALAQHSLRAGRCYTSSTDLGLVWVSCPCHASTNVRGFPSSSSDFVEDKLHLAYPLDPRQL